MRLDSYGSRFPFGSLYRSPFDNLSTRERAGYDLEALEEDRYRLTLNVAGLGEDEIEVETLDGVLKIEGKSEDDRFQVKQTFRLGEHIEVAGARLDKGLLTVELQRELPEALKPRRIAVESGATAKLPGKAKKLIGGRKKAA